MSTAEQTIVGEIVTNNIHQPIKFDVTNEAIRTLSKRLTGLKADTPANYLAVKSGITEVRTLRVRVDATRKELKEDALKYGRLVESEAKRITDLLVAIEGPLKAEKQKADDAKELEKQLIFEAKQRALQTRIDALIAVGFNRMIHVPHWTDEEYIQELAKATDEWNAKLRKEASDKAETERVEAEQAEASRLEKIAYLQERQEFEIALATARKLDAERAEQNRVEREAIEAERKAMQAERERIDKEEKERQQAIYLERLSKEKYERDLAHAIECQALVAEQDKLVAIREADEAKRIEAFKPDAEKLKILGDTLRLIAFPEMATIEGTKCILEINRRLHIAAEYCDTCLS